MIGLFKLLCSLFLIFLLVPQHPDDNPYLDYLHSTAFLITYRGAKNFLYRFTWGSIIIYILIMFIL